jgi:hypothetical protein
MLNHRWLAFVFLSIALASPLLADTDVDHRFYYSRTVIRPSRFAHTLEMEMRLFTDDLELAIDNDEERSFLGTDRESSNANYLIENYLRQHFALYINDQYVDFRFFGKEVDFDITYCYLECSIPRSIHSFEIQNTALMDVYYEQVNEIDVTLNGIRKRLMLNYEQPSALMTF